MKTARQIVARELLVLAKSLIGYEFPSKEKLDDYLRLHPKADKANHWVKNQKPQEKSTEPKTEEKIVKKETEEKTPKTKTEEKSVVSKFQIPEHKMLKFEAPGNLGNIDNWKARIVLNNSPSEKKKVGDMGEVGYVAINPNSNEIVPIARSDEHQAGYELLHHLSNKGAIRGRPQDFITLFPGNNYPHYSTSDTRKYAAACKKYLEYGGKNCAVCAVKQGKDGGTYVTDMEEYVALNSDLPYGSKKPSKPGREILEHLEGALEGVKAGDSKAAFDHTKKAFERMNEFRFYVVDSIDEFEEADKKRAQAEKDGDLDGLKKALKMAIGDMQKQVSSDSSYQKEKTDGIMGEGDEGRERVKKMAGSSDLAAPKSDNGLSEKGQSVVESLEGAATAAAKGDDYSSVKRMKNKAEELSRQLAPIAEDVEGLGSALARLDRAIVGDGDEELEMVLFSFNGVKNLLHNRLRQLDKAGVAKDKHFGDVKKALAEFDRLGQI